MRLAISWLVIGVALAACGAKTPPEEPKAKAPAEAPPKAEAPVAPSHEKPDEPPPDAPVVTVKVEIAGLDPNAAASKLHALTQGTNTAAGLRALPVANEVAIEIFADACDGKRAECTRKEMFDPSGFVRWVDEVVIDPPGWDTGDVDRCTKDCCTLHSVSKAAATEGLSPPHGMFQLDKVCFALEAGKVTTVKALHFTEL
jgi:hypothetical protein